MLSNKLTFSLASLIVLLMVGLCLPVSAQVIQVPTRIPLPVPTTTEFDADSDGNIEIGDFAAGTYGPAGFVVYSETAQAALPGGSGIAGTTSINQIVVPSPGLPDLAAFFRFGGTLALIGPAMIGPNGGTVSVAARDFVISEIMWANDVDNPSTTNTGMDDRRQWIEIYNTMSDDNGRPMATPVIQTGDTIELVFIPFRHVEGDANILAAAMEAATPTGGAAVPSTHIVYDVMSNLQFGKWDMPGMDGNTTPPGTAPLDPPLAPLVSAYRNINYARVQGINNLNNDNTVNTVENRNWQLHLNDSIRDGYNPGSWIASDALGRRNTLSNLFVGSPGVQHTPTLVHVGVTRDTLPADPPVIITEVRNDASSANVDWVELHNRSTEPVGLWDWELTIIQANANIANTETVLVGFDEEYTPAQRLERGFPPNDQFRLGPGEYLLIVNRDPRETVLADGVNIDAQLAETNVNAGATHQYIVRSMLNLPDANISLVLRNHVERNARHARPPNKDRVAAARTTTNTDSSLNIQDYVGNFRQAVTTNEYNTQVWPFKGWTARSRADGSNPQGIPHDPANPQSAARLLDGANSAVYRLGAHDDVWDAVGSVGGLGYDPGVDRRMAPGTPGYANNPVRNALVDNRGTLANTADDLMYDGEISISEVMVDAGERWNLVQWIEIYNSSMSQVVDLGGWEMEIRNATDEVQSYVDSSFIFNDNTTILPNQTLLIVSGTGTNDVPDNRVYNLFENHRRDLGLTNRRSVLLSPDGFYLRLRAPIPHTTRGPEWEMIDEAGNVMVDGATRNIMWELEDWDALDARQSYVRQYGDRQLYDGTPDPADPGTMMESWKLSDLTGAGISFYGHRDDISTPGYRLGGPLPVSLSKFRPVRNQTTGHVDIQWITESELNNAGFNILRSEAKNGEFKVINVKGIIAGHGTTSEKHVYTFTDTTAKPNVVYYYQIEDVSINGLRTTLTTTHLRGHVGAAGKLTTRWGELKSSGK